MALERGEARVCRVVRVPSVEQEDDRRRSRERARLVNERGQHSSRIKGLLMTHGIRAFAPSKRDWRERLDELRDAIARRGRLDRIRRQGQDAQTLAHESDS